MVRLRALAFTAINFSIEHGRLGQSSLPVEKLEVKSSEAKEVWARGGCAGALHLVPLYPETYARSFPRVGIVRLLALAFTVGNK